MKSLAFAMLCVTYGCTPHYDYQFELTNPGAQRMSAQKSRLEDEQLSVEIAFSQGALLLELANKTDDVLQVEWNKIVLEHGDGRTSSLRPDVDLGWISPGGKVAARLIPFVVPRAGEAAERYRGRKLQLSIPLLVRRLPMTYRLQFVAHLQPLT